MKYPILGANITRVSDLEGEMTKIICAEYDEPTGICRLKKSAAQGGMLSQCVRTEVET